jgi:hypothetical protein
MPIQYVWLLCGCSHTSTSCKKQTNRNTEYSQYLTDTNIHIIDALSRNIQYIISLLENICYIRYHFVIAIKRTRSGNRKIRHIYTLNCPSKRKGKVVHVHSMDTYVAEGGGTDPLILNLDTRWSWVIRLTVRRL